MIQNRTKIVLTYLLLSCLWASAVTIAGGKDSHRIKHEVYVSHPAISTEDSIAVHLFQWREKEGYRYYVDVESVSCGDNQCNVVPVRMYFDELGNFIRLQTFKHQQLEKTNGELFKKADYQKLSAILNDRDSELARFYKDQLVEKQHDLDEVDAVSSATTPLLSEEAYVKGAVWTCYTLWHWANGDLSQIIRDISGDVLTVEQILAFLDSEQKAYRVFALEQIARLHNYDSVVVDKLILHTRDCTAPEQNLILKYFEQGPAQIYYFALKALFPVAPKEMRIKCLLSLQNAASKAPDDYFVQLSNLLSEFESYQEIDLLLSVLEKHGVSDPEVLNNVFYLLRSEQVLVARRAYWFLVEKELNKAQRAELDTFAKLHAENLSGM